MERRSLLIGSGVVFATVLAGCTGDDEPDDDDREPGVEDGDSDDDGTDGGDGESIDDVPGFDENELNLDEHGLKIDRVKRDGTEIHVEVEATEAALAEENLEYILDAVTAAVVDPDAFKGTISTVELTVLDDAGNTIVSFFVDVAWVVDYVHGELSEDELTERVSETAG